MSGGVDSLGLLRCPMVHPHDNVAVGIFRWPYCQGVAVCIEYHQGAGGIKADACHVTWGNAGCGNRLFDAGAHR
ncbi:hypothetical protein D3C79_598210 [compost metagenome]